jgi:hypothetical protein
LDLNLETLKSEIEEYLAASDFAVFHSYSGGLDGMQVISWDIDSYPDYRMFLEAARKAGQKLILFGARDFDEAELEEATDDLEVLDLTPSEKREFEKRFRDARRRIGSVCALELAFEHGLHLYVYEVQPDWYEEFQDAAEELSTMLPLTEDIEGDDTDGLGGFYSNN